MGDSKAILASWQANAEAWLSAVREQRIDSRRVTDAAVLEAVKAGAPRRILDVGCGEAWLCRALHDDGIETVGIDATAPLIDAARAAGAGRFEVLRYDELVADPLRLGQFDGVVLNFALFEADPRPLLRALTKTLDPAGRLILQTVHPERVAGDEGWREERFAGFGAAFPAAMPWYFRSMASWERLLLDAGWRLIHQMAPADPSDGPPLSLILIAAPRSSTGGFSDHPSRSTSPWCSADS
jgi:2-polyprenyl-3-methyl-5-hydroxy-6-metoxy-1,4-benzoquinol methylase